MQCDFDTIGTTSVAADIETILVIHDLLVAIGFERKFTIRVNNRGDPQRAAASSWAWPSRPTAVLRALDKLAKMGPEKVAAELESTAGATHEQADRDPRLLATPRAQRRGARRH